MDKTGKGWYVGRSRGFLLTVICGGLLGVVGTVVFWIQQVLANSYVEYGMHRLSFYKLVGVWNPVVLGCAGVAALLYGLCILLVYGAHRSRTRVIRSAMVVSVTAIAVLAADWVLRLRAGFGMSHALSRVAAKVAGLVSGELGVAQLRQTFVTNLEAALLMAAGQIAVALLFILVLRLPWERLPAWIVVRSRHLGRAGMALAALTLLLNALQAYDRRMSPPSGPNVIMITIDCLRHDHVGYSGYRGNPSPNIDDLARRGIVFRNAYSNAPWTKPSVGTLFTSLYPAAHTALSYVSVLPADALTVAEILKNGGYFTVFLNSENPFVTKRFGFHQGFDVAQDYGTGRDAARLTDAFLSMLPDVRGRKFFAYLHYMDMHLPYSDNEFSREVDGSTGRGGPRLLEMDAGALRKRTADGEMSEEDRAYVEALYDGQLRYVDKHLGRLFDSLDAAGLREETLIVILADHGEEFWEHGNFEHGHTLYEELLHIPLVLSGWKLHGAVVNKRISLVDLMPTVLELVGIGSENLALQGESTGSLLENAPDENVGRPVYAVGTLYGREKYCVIRGDDKLIINSDDYSGKLPLDGSRSASPQEVYCLRDDPLEQNDLSGAESRTLRELGELIHDFNLLGGRKKAENTTIDDELERKLRSVGYL